MKSNITPAGIDGSDNLHDDLLPVQPPQQLHHKAQQLYSYYPSKPATTLRVIALSMSVSLAMVVTTAAEPNPSKPDTTPSQTLTNFTAVEDGSEVVEGSLEDGSFEIASSDIDSSDISNANHEHIRQARETLLEVITSDNYAKSEEVETWEQIEKESSTEVGDSWFLDFIEDLFESLLGDETDLSALPMILKGLFIIALIIFIIWVIKNASDNGWFATIKRRLRLNKAPSVSKYQPSLLPQSWEDLPPHRMIPQQVMQLIHKGDSQSMVMAASILYRGSLRWLNDTHSVAIAPASTEKKCLTQIERISTMAGSPASTLAESSVDYLTQLIYLWLEMAYAPPAKKQALGSAPLQQMAEQWLAHLPASDSAKSSTKYVTVAKSNPRQQGDEQ